MISPRFFLAILVVTTNLVVQLPAAEPDKAADKPPLKIIPGQVIVPIDKMRRIWGELVSLDLDQRTGTFRAESTDELMKFNVMPYAELLHHATNGDLQDFRVGERAIFRLHENEAGQWIWLTYIQDEMNFLNNHREYYYVDRIDADKHAVECTDANFDKSFVREPGILIETDEQTRFWKAGQPAKFSDIHLGDKLRTQTHGVGKGKSRVAWNVFLDDESLLKFQSIQKEVHAKRMADAGAPGYIDRWQEGELSITLFQEASDAVKSLAAGQKVRVAPAGVDRKPTSPAVTGVVVSAKPGRLTTVTIKLDSTKTDFPLAGLARLWLVDATEKIKGATNDGSPAGKRPNILFAISDDQSWPHASAYGCRFVDTPAFDRVAKRGLLFNNAYTPNAKCAPSRACILTGRNSWQLESGANHIGFWPERFKSFIEGLAAGGYAVGFTGKGWGPGEAKGRPLTGQAFQKQKAKPPTTGINANNYAGNFAEFLQQKPADHPFCFWYGGFEPHRPYQFKSGSELGGKKTGQIDRVPSPWPDDEIVRHDMLDYAFEIEYFDHHLDEMLKLLEKNGELDNTLVVVTSDNGMPFPHCKGQAYDASNHLPLAIMWSRGIVKPGRTVDQYVSFIDLAPTFLQVAGLSVEQAGMQQVEGKSLTDIFDNQPATGAAARPDYVLIGKEFHDTGRPNNAIYPIRGIVRDGFLFVHNLKPDLWPAGNPLTGYPETDGSPTKSLVLDLRRKGETDSYWKRSFGKRPERELFDLRSDRDCVENLADTVTHALRAKELETLLVRELTRQHDPRIVGPENYFESFPSSNPSWNYYERLKKGENVATPWLSDTDREASDD